MARNAFLWPIRRLAETVERPGDGQAGRLATGGMGSSSGNTPPCPGRVALCPGTRANTGPAWIFGAPFQGTAPASATAAARRAS